MIADAESAEIDSAGLTVDLIANVDDECDIMNDHIYS